MINYMFDSCTFTPINQETEPEKWCELRTTGIGGSDAGAILGMNKYSSKLSVYLSKKGVKGFVGNSSTEWGHILEDPIRKKTADELGIKIYIVPGMYTNKENTFMNANIDGLCHANHPIKIGGETVEGWGGHEIKTSATGEGFTDDEIPDSYYCQVQHYMAVTELKWFILTVFILNKKVGKHYIIPVNYEFINDKLIPAERDFWYNNVLENNPPEPSGVDSENDYVKSLSYDNTIDLDDKSQELICNYLEIDSQIKELSSKQSQIKNSILLHLNECSTGFEDAEKTTATGGKYKLTYNLQVRKSIDTDAIKKDGLFDKYCKESSSKVLRITEIKL